MTDNIKFKTREEWLVAAIELMRPLFKKHSYEIPTLRVTCGWPHRGGTGNAKGRVLGQCWAEDAAADGINQLFVSPYLEDKQDDPCGTLGVLIHEVVHAVVGVKNAHNKVFKKCAEAVGLTGKMTCALPGPELFETCKAWSVELGTYPHAKLDLNKSPVKKQATRMIKMVCLHSEGDKECGYTARTSRKWLDEVGIAHCPKHGEMSVDLPAAKGDDEGDGE